MPSVLPSPVGPHAPQVAEAGPGGFARLRAIARAPVRWLGILLVPDRAVPETVAAGRYGGSLLVATAAALLAALTIAGHLDLGESVLDAPPEASAGPATAEPQRSEREVAEAIDKARSIEQVTRGLHAGALPVELALLAVALFGVTRYVGGRPTMRRAMALASAAALPVALRSLLAALAASRRPSLPPADVASLVIPPLHLGGPVVLARLAAGLDPFVLWSAALVALGLPALAGLGRRRSLVTVAVCFLLWLVVTQLILGDAGSPHPPGGLPS